MIRERDMADFFREGRSYRHFKDGMPSTEGVFLVKCVGRAPTSFEHHLGVAFGWRQGLSVNGVVQSLGSYGTPDFAGWREMSPVEAETLLARGT